MVKVLLCHNYYQQAGGEDYAFRADASLLEKHGLDVVRYTKHNAALDQMSPVEMSARTLWNHTVYTELRELIRRERPDVAHFHNIFPLMSPAVYYAARAEGVAVVQTLHNYRLLCPGATLLRNERVCEDCVGRRVAWPAIRHGCYRGDHSASAVVTALLGVHRAMHTWHRMVDRYITPSGFLQRKVVEAGVIDAGRITVRAAPVLDVPEPGTGRGDYVVFVGRLAPEKGIETLIEAWRLLDGRVALKIVGDGPLSGQVREFADATPGVEWLGHRPRPEVLRTVGEAMCAVVPSIWHEPVPLALVEAFAVGTPAVVSRLGNMADLVDHERTGLHVEPRNPADLASKVLWMRDHPAELSRMRLAAHREFEDGYGAERSRRLLLETYAQAVATRGALRSERWDRSFGRERFSGTTERTGSVPPTSRSRQTET